MLCCSASEPPMPMYMFLYARFPMSEAKSPSGFPPHGGQSHARPVSENQSRILIPSPPTVERLEHEGSTLGLLVTTVSVSQNLSVKFRCSKFNREGPPGGFAETVCR